MGKGAKAKAPEGRNLVVNRRARFEFEILERIQAGLVLKGSEVKALRAGRASLAESYVRIEDGEAFWIKGTIDEHPGAGAFGHEPKRRRKLLLKKHEIRRLFARVRERGLTLVPLRIYVGERNFLKMEIALARGRKLHDKREEQRRRDARREVRDYG